MRPDGIERKFALEIIQKILLTTGPHDFAVRFSAVRQKHIRVHRIPPRVS